MSATSAAITLQTVAIACATVADYLNHAKNEHPHTLKKITAQGKAAFRFTTVVRVDGEEVEVQVKNYHR
jgi:hypothetical protein